MMTTTVLRFITNSLDFNLELMHNSVE